MTEFRCTGKLKNGKPCRHMFGKYEIFGGSGTLEAKCPKCKNMSKLVWVSGDDFCKQSAGGRELCPDSWKMGHNIEPVESRIESISESI